MVVFIFVRILIIFFFKFSCYLYDIFLICMNVNLGVIKCFFSWVSLSLFGSLGNFNLFVIKYVGICFNKIVLM